MLRAVAPWRVEIVDSAESTAKVVAQQLGHSQPATRDPELHFFATDSVEKFRRLGERFMGRPIANVEHVEMEG
jgi:glutamate racemase